MSNLFNALTQSPYTRIALQIQDGPLLTYGDLSALSARYANVLSSHGIIPGDRVVAQTEKSIASLGLYLACLRVGAIFLPLNTAYTSHELAYFIADAQPKLVVLGHRVPRAILDPTGQIQFAIESLDANGSGSMAIAASNASTSHNVHRADANDLAALLYTSGTTGRPKGAMISHGNLLSNARALKDVWQFTSGDVLLHALPTYHAHGLFVGINVPLLAGARIHLLPRFETTSVISSLPSSTVFMGVPTFYTRLLQTNELASATRAIRLFISGSAPLLPETHHAWRTRTEHNILERYGMTETQMIASNPYDGIRQPGSVGMPLDGVEVRVVEPSTGEELPEGQTGMIEVRGPNVFKGYWRMPDMTRSDLHEDGFFRTGDLGYIDKNNYIFIVGRQKDLIITGGFNVYPREIEIELDAMDGVAESAVIGLAHPDFGEGVTAVVVAEKGRELDLEELLRLLERKLAKFKLPKKIITVDELPRNAMGKVQKAVLRQQMSEVHRY